MNESVSGWWFRGFSYFSLPFPSANFQSGWALCCKKGVSSKCDCLLVTNHCSVAPHALQSVWLHCIITENPSLKRSNPGRIVVCMCCKICAAHISHQSQAQYEFISRFLIQTQLSNALYSTVSLKRQPHHLVVKGSIWIIKPLNLL